MMKTLPFVLSKSSPLIVFFKSRGNQGSQAHVELQVQKDPMYVSLSLMILRPRHRCLMSFCFSLQGEPGVHGRPGMTGLEVIIFDVLSVNRFNSRWSNLIFHRIFPSDFELKLFMFQVSPFFLKSDHIKVLKFTIK